MINHTVYVLVCVTQSMQVDECSSFCQTIYNDTTINTHHMHTSDSIHSIHDHLITDSRGGYDHICEEGEHIRNGH